MSGATYQIDVFRDMAATGWPWKAHLRRIADGEILAVKIGDTREQVEREAREAVVSLAMADDPANRPLTLYVDDSGQDVAP